MRRSLPDLFARRTSADAPSRAELLAALQQDGPRRRNAVLAYLDGESPAAIAQRLGIQPGGLWSLIDSSMRACYRRVYGESLPTPHAGRPSRQARRTGYRTDGARHEAARQKVPAKRRRQIAAAGGAARAKLERRP